MKRFLAIFSEDVNLYLDGGTWKVQANWLDREIQERGGDIHKSLKTCRDDIGNLLTKYILAKMKERKLPTANCSVHLVIKEFILKAFVAYGKDNLFLVTSRMCMSLLPDSQW